jgi:hypothetical protein
MTSLIRATDVDTNQIKPFMPSDLFFGLHLPSIFLLFGTNSNFVLSFKSNPRGFMSLQRPLSVSCLRLPLVR